MGMPGTKKGRKRQRNPDRLRLSLLEQEANMGMPGTCCDVSGDGTRIAVGHAGGQFTVWDANVLLCVTDSN